MRLRGRWSVDCGPSEPEEDKLLSADSRYSLSSLDISSELLTATAELPSRARYRHCRDAARDGFSASAGLRDSDAVDADRRRRDDSCEAAVAMSETQVSGREEVEEAGEDAGEEEEEERGVWCEMSFSCCCCFHLRICVAHCASAAIRRTSSDVGMPIPVYITAHVAEWAA